MPRSRPRPSTTPTAKAPAKRARPPTTPTRQSKRIKTTPKKSAYFEHDSSASSAESADEDASEASGYEDEDASVTEATPTSDEEDAEEEPTSSEDERSRKRKKGSSAGRKSTTGRSKPASSAGTPKAAASGTELWREGVRSHLAPGEEIFIALPKARPAGKVAYADNKLHPNTLLFLGDLAAHNERAWLKTHDADFRQAERDFKSWAEGLGTRLSDDVDASVPELPFKDVVMRIYRDVRFSRDPTPYKPHFSVAWSRTGRKGPYAAYYLQVGKGKSFFGGGLWQPPADQLATIRRAIDSRAAKLKGVLMREGLRRSFLSKAAKGADQKKVVKAFCDANKEGALKTRPKDYPADHPEIDLLKLKSFTLGYKLKDEEITAPDSMERIVRLMRDMEPWVTYLNSVVMPDGDGSSSDDDDEGEEDGDEDEEEDGKEGEPEPNGDVDSEDPGPDSDEPEDWEPE